MIPVKEADIKKAKKLHLEDVHPTSLSSLSMVLYRMKGVSELRGGKHLNKPYA